MGRNTEDNTLSVLSVQLKQQRPCASALATSETQTQQKWWSQMDGHSRCPLTSPANHSSHLWRIRASLVTLLSNQFIYAASRNHLAWWEVKVNLAGRLPDWHLAELVGRRLHSPSLLSPRGHLASSTTSFLLQDKTYSAYRSGCLRAPDSRR